MTVGISVAVGYLISFALSEWPDSYFMAFSNSATASGMSYCKQASCLCMLDLNLGHLFGFLLFALSIAIWLCREATDDHELHRVTQDSEMSEESTG